MIHFSIVWVFEIQICQPLRKASFWTFGPHLELPVFPNFIGVYRKFWNLPSATGLEWHFWSGRNLVHIAGEFLSRRWDPGLTGKRAVPGAGPPAGEEGNSHLTRGSSYLLRRWHAMTLLRGKLTGAWPHLYSQSPRLKVILRLKTLKGLTIRMEMLQGNKI